MIHRASTAIGSIDRLGPASPPEAMVMALRRSPSTLRSAAAALPLALIAGLIAGAPVLAQERGAASKGAQIYCFMRNSGNSHQVSWDAAYAVIKRQGDGPFKTSPQHAAVLITETVVQNPGDYPDCGRFLGDLFRQPEAAPAGTATPKAGTTRGERYGS
jgi:hypothetical protein